MIEMDHCVYVGSFLHFHILEVLGKNGEKFNWEMTCRRHQNYLQGVDVIAKIGSEYILNLEKRHPVGGFVISFPGGIRDIPDTIGEGLKELREETGYIGAREASSEGPLVYIDPWKSNDKTQFITVELDQTENLTPHQELEDLEEIQVLKLPKENLLEAIQNSALEHSAKIDSRLFAYSLGLFYGTK